MKSMYMIKKWFKALPIEKKANLIKKHYGSNALDGGFSITDKVRKHIYLMEQEESAKTDDAETAKLQSNELSK